MRRSFDSRHISLVSRRIPDRKKLYLGARVTPRGLERNGIHLYSLRKFFFSNATVEEAEQLINSGWEYVGILSNGKVVIKS